MRFQQKQNSQSGRKWLCVSIILKRIPMKSVCTLLNIIVLIVVLLTSLQSDVYAQLWQEFAHPNSPHVDNNYIHLNIPALFDNSANLPVRLPVLVVLLEFQDVAGSSTGQHPAAFWRDLVFANNRAGNRPSIADIFRENSNGRLLMVPATAGDRYDGIQDGVVGWVRSQHATTDSFWTQDGIDDEGAMRGRAEGIIVADPFFDYFRYDTNGDGLITNDELVILVVFADDNLQVCDYHVGHNPAPGTGCIGIPGGRARRTHPEYIDVDIENSESIRTHQFMAGVREMVRVGVVAHELGHTAFGLGDLYAKNCNNFQQVVDGYQCDGVWYPPVPGIFSLMSHYPDSDPPNSGYITHLDPWGKIHLGFIKPMVVTHDGTYTLWDAETERNFSTQDTQPEAIIIYDPLNADPYKEYFILENRNMTGLSAAQMDDGIAVWLINEDGPNWPDGLNLRKVDRLIRRNGHHVPDSLSLWDGVPQTDGYDLTATSMPRNTSWTDGSRSYIEVYEISAAGPTMTFKVRMPPIFVNRANTGGEDGSQAHPYTTVLEGLSAIPEPPRTIRIAGGSYPETMAINTPCTLMGWKNGNVVIGQ